MPTPHCDPTERLSAYSLLESSPRLRSRPSSVPGAQQPRMAHEENAQQGLPSSTPSKADR